MDVVPPNRATRRPNRWRPQLAAWAFIAPVAIYLVIFYAYPLYRNIDLSLRNYTLRSFIDGTADFDDAAMIFAASAAAPLGTSHLHVCVTDCETGSSQHFSLDF